MSRPLTNNRHRTFSETVRDWLHYQDYQLVSWLFIRSLGVIYLIAFASLWTQVQGLAGAEGILPAGALLEQVASQTGWERYLVFPTVFWLNSSNMALVGVCLYGCVVSLQIIFNCWQRASLILAFILYLSLYNVCQPFLHFQWDGLLLEAGFLAVFLGLRSSIVIWLFRWLLFKLRFMSGLSKLTSGDPAWPELTALNTYFEVQPLPNPLAWYAHHLPEVMLRAATAATLVIEILVPLMMFMPRRWRFTAAWITIFWQLLIILTSNHNWINLLTIALCLFLFDDRALRRVLPFGFNPLQSAVLIDATPVARLRTLMLSLVAAFILLVSSLQLWMLGTGQEVTGWPGKLIAYLETYRIANMYHVFPTMTTERIELELSGSMDGREWKTYRFKYKPGDPGQRPQLVMPHQPRLDWQMWFVTLHPKHLPWFEEFCYALLENAADATALLEYNPFADQPPRYISVDAYRYHFTTPEERQQTGNWWKREALGPFLPMPGVQNNSE